MTFTDIDELTLKLSDHLIKQLADIVKNYDEQFDKVIIIKFLCKLFLILDPYLQGGPSTASEEQSQRIEKQIEQLLSTLSENLPVLINREVLTEILHEQKPQSIYVKLIFFSIFNFCAACQHRKMMGESEALLDFLYLCVKKWAKAVRARISGSEELEQQDDEGNLESE